MRVWRAKPPGRSQGHWYTTDHANHKDKVLPSVTGITGILDKPGLVPAAVKLSVEKLAEQFQLSGDDQTVKAAKKHYKEVWGTAAKEGTEAHIIAARMMTGEEYDVPASLPSIVESVDLYRESLGDIEIIGVERLLAHPFLNYAGAADFIYSRNGQVTIDDWKTGSIGYPEQAAQLAGYALAYAQERFPDLVPGEVPPIEARVVRLNKADTPGYTVRVVNLCNAIRMFVAAHELWVTSKQEVWSDVDLVEEQQPLVSANAL